MVELVTTTIAANFLLSTMIANVCLGLFSGFLAGLFGIGGGMVIVPILFLLFTAQGLPADLVMIMAVATSLAIIILTATASVFAHHRLGSVMWGKVLQLTPGILVGALLGGSIADAIRSDYLRWLYVIFLLFVGIQMALDSKPKPGTTNDSRLLDVLVAIVIGLLSALVGIGGGTLTVPYLVHCRYPMRNAVATASACGLFIAVASTISYVLLGMKAARLPELCLGYVYLPAFFGVGLGSIITAPLGAKLAHKLPAQQLKRYFAILIFLMVIKIIGEN